MKYDKTEIADQFGSRESSVGEKTTSVFAASSTGNKMHMQRPSVKIPASMAHCENSVEDIENTPLRVREGNMNLPNLLGEYDCGDEPEEQDDSAVAGSVGESGESENDMNDMDNENEEIADSPEIKQEGDD